MRTITLPRHFWLSFRHVSPAREQVQTAPKAAVQDTKPRAPATFDERFWSVSQVRVLGITLPNRYQTGFFSVLCLALSLPVFLLDSTGHGLYHGLVTFASIAAFAAFCWLTGMLIAHTSAEDPRDPQQKPYQS